MTTVADDLLDVLVRAGVTRIYGLVGDSLNALSDSVRRSGGAAKGGMDWVHVYNEEGAAFAASAEAQLTGRLAVCAGSCGPGNTHLIQGIMDAHRSGAPVLALATQIESRQIGTGYFQETKPEVLFGQASTTPRLCLIPIRSCASPVARSRTRSASGARPCWCFPVTSSTNIPTAPSRTAPWSPTVPALHHRKRQPQSWPGGSGTLKRLRSSPVSAVPVPG